MRGAVLDALWWTSSNLLPSRHHSLPAPHRTQVSVCSSLPPPLMAFLMMGAVGVFVMCTTAPESICMAMSALVAVQKG